MYFFLLRVKQVTFFRRRKNPKSQRCGEAVCRPFPSTIAECPSTVYAMAFTASVPICMPTLPLISGYLYRARPQAVVASTIQIKRESRDPRIYMGPPEPQSKVVAIQILKTSAVADRIFANGNLYSPQ